jgi:2-polyprenyl-3-methyl-5-hydroxy-6-metoxy-1,4-benzoquinol methylase
MSDVPADFELIRCPGCGEDRFAPAREAGNPTLDPKLSFKIVRCESCGLHFTNPRPMLSALGRFYPKEYSPYQSEKGPAAGKAGSVRNLVLRDAFAAPAMKPTGFGKFVAKVVEKVRRPEWYGFGVAYRGRGRLLDFGCGSGKFLRRMNALGWDVTGVDFSDEAVNAVQKSGLRAYQGTLPHPELKPESFDVVTMRHALEHVPDPPAILRHAWELLDHGGLMLIQVPNYAGWDVDYFERASLGLDLPRHLTHFTPQTLQAMLEHEGMKSIAVRQVSHANWIRKAAKRSDGYPKSATVFRLTPACRVAAAVAQLTGRGNEIIASAVKP